MVLDGADLSSRTIRSMRSTTLAEQIPDGSLLVLAGRAQPRTADRRACAPASRLFEIGPDMLALSRREARLLLRATGLELADAGDRRASSPAPRAGRRASTWPR